MPPRAATIDRSRRFKPRPESLPENDSLPGASGTGWIDVVAADIDRLGHVNNSIYLRWIEQAVHAHWLACATEAESAAFEWIALRHEIDYRLPALLGDRLTVGVRLDEVRRARAWYVSIVSRADVPLVEARSCWGCLDAVTRRLTVIPPETAQRILTARPPGS